MRIRTFFVILSVLVTSKMVGFTHASTELDRKYLLETVGVLRAVDNVDGVFASYLQEVTRNYLKSQSRFQLIELGSIDGILKESKIPYFKLIEDSDILAQVARTSRTDTLLRTKFIKEGTQYRVQLDWLLAPKMELLASETKVIEEPKDAPKLDTLTLQTELNPVFERLFGRVPYFGHVVGRDGESVVINLGSQSRIRTGDRLKVSTVEVVRTHPLLKSVVEWRLAPVGELEVQQIDERIAFCKVISQENDREIAKLHKISAVLESPSAEIVGRKSQGDELVEVGSGQSVQRGPEDWTDEEKPKLGWLQGVAWLGSLGRTYSYTDGAEVSANKTGSGLLVGGKLEGQLWINQDWFVDGAAALGSASAFSQTDLDGENASDSVPASAFFWRGFFGKMFLLKGTMSGPRAFVKAGYQSFGYTFPSVTDEYLGSTSFKGPVLSIGADLPIRHRFGLQFGIEYGMFQSMSETGLTTGTLVGSQTLGIQAGGTYWLAPRMTIRVGMDLATQTADFGENGNVGQTVVAFGPSLLFYF